MFGMGGLGGGYGSRRSSVRSIRLVALVALLVLGTAFHHQGSAYDSIRIVYYAVIIGALGYAFWRRRARGPRPSAQAGVPGSFPGGGQERPPTPGWYPEQGSAAVQRYWDGSTWGGRRRWDGASWVSE